MNSELSLQYVNEQYENLLSYKAIIEHHKWRIERDGFDIFVWMQPKNRTEELFLVRLRCDDYPQRSPTLQFVEPTSKEPGYQHWPQVGPFQAAINRSKTMPQFCIPGIREFHEGCHAGDSGNPWVPEKFPFIKILENTKILLDKHLQ